MQTTITSEQIAAINDRLIAMKRRKTQDIDHLVSLDASAPTIKVEVRTSKRFADTWQYIETFFVEPTGYVSNGQTVLLLKQDDKAAA